MTEKANEPPRSERDAVRQESVERYRRSIDAINRAKDADIDKALRS